MFMVGALLCGSAQSAFSSRRDSRERSVSVHLSVPAPWRLCSKLSWRLNGQIEEPGKYVIVPDGSTVSIEAKDGRRLGSWYEARIDGEDTRVDGHHYRGELLFRSRSLVNVLGLNEYLYGVVAREMGGAAEPEALKAQAVVTRTYTLAHLGHEEITDDVRFQAYAGCDGETAASIAAVDETDGQVLTYQGLLARNVCYHSTCGGHTEDNENVFGTRPVPYLRGVPCEVPVMLAAPPLPASPLASDPGVPQPLPTAQEAASVQASMAAWGTPSRVSAATPSPWRASAAVSAPSRVPNMAPTPEEMMFEAPSSAGESDSLPMDGGWHSGASAGWTGEVGHVRASLPSPVATSRVAVYAPPPSPAAQSHAAMNAPPPSPAATPVPTSGVWSSRGTPGSSASADRGMAPTLQVACAASEHAHWTVPLGREEAETLSIVRRTAGGRVACIRLGHRYVRGDEIRRALRFRDASGRLRNLYSTNFTIEQTPSGARLVGSGWGHGVGLCQWGARGMARAGWTYQQILQHYFAGTQISAGARD